MKKNYLFLAAATTLFAACVQTDVVNDIPEPQQQAISFETFANKQTRTGETPAASATNLETHHTTFSVWASKQLTTDTYVDVYGTSSVGSVSHNGSEWIASPVKFWDKAALNYYFYAAAPTDAGWVLNSTQGVTTNVNTVGTNGKFTLTNFTLSGTNLATATASMVGTWIGKTDDDDDKDLMVATAETLTQTEYNISNPNPVSFTFRHILSKLNIKVKGVLTVQNAQIELNTLNVVGLMSKADYTDSSDDCDWSNWASTNDDYILTGGWSGSNLVLSTDYVYTHEYLIIPQEVTYLEWINKGTPPTTATVPYIYIDYNVVTTGTGSDASTENFKSYYSLADIFGDASLDFAEGGQYTLSVSIAPDAIEFTTTESPWIEKNTQDQTPDIDIE